MLEIIFKHFDSQEIDQPFLNPSLNLKDCLEAKAKAFDERDIKLRNFLAIKLGPSPDKKTLNLRLEDLQYTDRYLAFLQQIEIALSQKEPQLLLDLTIKLNLASFASFIFTQWLKHNAKDAQAFYSKYLEGFLQTRQMPEQEQLILSLGAACTNYFLTEIGKSLKYQTEPLAICKITDNLNATPWQLAACILWLLEQKVPAEQILASGIFHRYDQYSLFYSNSDGAESSLNSTTILNYLLSQFSISTELLQLASKRSCDARGYNCYNLLGQLTRDSLQPIELVPSPAFTRSTANLKNLLQLFDPTILVAIVNELYYQSGDEFDAYVISLMKQDYLPMLAGFITAVAQENSEKYIPKWLDFVDNELFQKWLDENQLVVLYLFPHKIEWAQYFSSENIQQLLTLIQSQRQANEMEVLHLLMLLYEVTAPKADPNINKLIYAAIFKLIFHHIYLLGDPHVLYVLKESVYLNEQITNQAVILSSNLDLKIQDFVSKELSYSNYTQLKRTWNLLLNEAENLLRLTKEIPIYPLKEIDFIVRVFQQYIKVSGPPFDKFFEILEISSMEHDYQQKIYSNLLANVDSVEVRDFILAKLQQTLESLPEKIILKSVEVKNMGLINAYLKIHPLSKQMIKIAIKNNHWSLFAQWFIEGKMTKLPILFCDEILHEIIKSENTYLLRFIIAQSQWKFSKPGLSTAFNKAAHLNQYQMLKSLFKLAPDEMILKVAFYHAIRHRSFEAIRFFQEIETTKPKLAYEVERAFNQAVKQKDLILLDMLLNFVGNPPPGKTIRKAKETARQQDNSDLLNVLEKKSVLPKEQFIMKEEGKTSLTIKCAASFRSMDSLYSPGMFSPKRTQEGSSFATLNTNSA